MKLSRRSMLALAGAGAVQAVAQTPAPPPDPFAKARQENQQGAATLSSFEIPMSTEPAFVFRP